MHNCNGAGCIRFMKKGHVFRWGNNQERAFSEAKEILRKIQIPVLSNDDVHKPLILTCDDSSYGVGAVLAHQIEDGKQPIAFHSRTMTPAERNYSLVENEVLAICCVRKFHKYLWGRHFKIYMDLLLPLLPALVNSHNH